MYTHFIFDLDQTVIDSTHRLGDGSLADWIANNTPRNILLDRESVSYTHLTLPTKA